MQGRRHLLLGEVGGVSFLKGLAAVDIPMLRTALPVRNHLSHCSPEGTFRLEKRRIEQCKRWHLRRTRAVSAGASGHLRRTLIPEICWRLGLQHDSSESRRQVLQGLPPPTLVLSLPRAGRERPAYAFRKQPATSAARGQVVGQPSRLPGGWAVPNLRQSA
jgi:hypothetical protein